MRSQRKTKLCRTTLEVNRPEDVATCISQKSFVLAMGTIERVRASGLRVLHLEEYRRCGVSFYDADELHQYNLDITSSKLLVNNCERAVQDKWRGEKIQMEEPIARHLKKEGGRQGTPQHVPDWAAI